jgi:uncharacterized protein (TIGR04255 family)
MSQALPSRLHKEPLINVLFEMRFEAGLPLSNILPGILYITLGCSDIVKTPHAELPEFVRNSDPNLAYAPLLYLTWDNYEIHISDRSVLLACKLPYKGWTQFKGKILELLEKINEASVAQGVERYSLKYVDLIKPSDDVNISSLLNINVVMGGNDFNLSSLQLRAERNEGDTIIIMQLLGQATAYLSDNSERSGLLIDIDCINNLNNPKLPTIMPSFSASIDKLHTVNKKAFFSLLTLQGTEYLEPSYE